MQGFGRPSFRAAVGLLWAVTREGHLRAANKASHKTKGDPGGWGAPTASVLVLCFRPSQQRVQMSESVPVGSLMLKNALQRLGGPIRQEPHWPPGPSPSVGSRRHSGPSGEWVRNLFTSILRYMRPFFFLFTIIVTLVNPSITDKSDYNVTGCRRGRKGDIYVYVQLLQDRQRCFSWDGGRTISEGHVSLWGVWRAG